MDQDRRLSHTLSGQRSGILRRHMSVLVGAGLVIAGSLVMLNALGVADALASLIYALDRPHRWNTQMRNVVRLEGMPGIRYGVRWSWGPGLAIGGLLVLLLSR